MQVWAKHTGMDTKIRGKEWLDKAKANCEKAMNIDAKLAKGHTCRSNVYLSQGKYNEALDEILIANRIDPAGCFHRTHYGGLL